MKIFVTGAHGFIGSAVAAELARKGHQVTGLAHTDAAAHKLAAAGHGVHRGDVQDVASLKAGAAASDGVIHCGFIHDFARYAEVCEIDRLAIGALGEALEGSKRPLLVSSGAALPTATNGLITEDARAQEGPHTPPRVKTELAIDAAAARGVRAAALRFPPTVHGAGDHGFIWMIGESAKKAGRSAYVGEGTNRWPAAHRLDVARLCRLAVECHFEPGARFHAVAEEGVPFREIATAIGRRLGLPTVSLTPEQATEHFGWMTHFASADRPTSSAITRSVLAWNPVEVGLLDDIAAAYF